MSQEPFGSRCGLLLAVVLIRVPFWPSMLDYSVLLPQREAAEQLRKLLPLWRTILGAMPAAGRLSECGPEDGLDRPGDLPPRWELIIVDDHSSDPCRRQLQQFCHQNPDTRVLLLMRPQGPTVAWEAALRAARGRIVIGWDIHSAMPASLALQLVSWLSKADMIVARHQLSWWRRWAGLPGRWLAGPPTLSPGCQCWVALREAVADIRFARNQHKLLPWLVAVRGFRVIGRTVPAHLEPNSPGWWTSQPHPLDLLTLWWQRQRLQTYTTVELTPSEQPAESTSAAQKPPPISWQIPNTGKPNTGKQDTGKQDTGKQDTGKQDTAEEALPAQSSAVELLSPDHLSSVTGSGMPRSAEGVIGQDELAEGKQESGDPGSGSRQVRIDQAEPVARLRPGHHCGKQSHNRQTRP